MRSVKQGSKSQMVFCGLVLELRIRKLIEKPFYPVCRHLSSHRRALALHRGSSGLVVVEFRARGLRLRKP